MPGDVLIRQLEYLVALAREQHFGRAAAACHASQPALSAAVRKLEIELGVTIVRRGHRFGGFTEEGRRVVGWAHRILGERDALKADLERMRQGLTATVRLGAIPTAVPASPLLTEALFGRHPMARMRVEVMPSREIVRRLGEFELDAGLTYLDGSGQSGAHGVPLYRERYLLLTSDDELLAGRTEIGWAEAAMMPLCALTTAMQNRRILDAAMAAQGARLAPVVEADTVAAIYAHVATRRWSSIIAHTWLHAFGVPNGMRVLPLAPRGPEPVVGLVTGDHQPMSIVSQALLDAVRGADVSRTLERSLTSVPGLAPDRVPRPTTTPG